MAIIPRDNNQIPTMSGVSSQDGTTQVAITADESSHVLGIEDDTTGSDHGPDRAIRDENGTTVLMAVSSADGTTPVPIYINATNGKILIKSS